MDKDVPEATDLLPRDGGVTQLDVIGQALSCFGQGLQISQGCVVEDFVSANAPRVPMSRILAIASRMWSA